MAAGASMIEQFDGMIFDVDGVLEYQKRVYPGAVELIDRLRSSGTAVRILTNSTLKSRHTAASKLRGRGFTIEDEQVITASYATAQYLRQLNIRSCRVMLKGEGREEFRDLPQDDEHPEYLVLGDCRDEFNFQNLNKAAKVLNGGAKLIVMIPEMIDSSLGEMELTVGAYGRMLELALDIEAVYIGKPSRYIFEATLDSMGLRDRDRVLMVGDKTSTDILGAKNAGVRSALIRTGEFSQDGPATDVKPDYTFDSIAELADFLFKGD
jgi:HAD superfamily hydrolase (TIGR01458 family)